MADPIVAGLILAGGASARMGQPKALLEFQALSFVARGVATIRAGGVARVFVVDGAHRLDPALAGLTDVEEVEIVHNPDWQLGPLASIQAGLRRALQVEPELAGLLVHHVERPRVQVQTIARLLAAFADQPDALWQPVVPGSPPRSGHPMVWPRGLFAPLLALDPAQHTARTLVRGSAAGLRRSVEVDDPGVLDNIDTPADLARLLGPRVLS